MECKCKDPENSGGSERTGSCKFPKFKADGNCDDKNNNCGCDYDGGDCCTATVKNKGTGQLTGKVKTAYCSECKCLDPTGQAGGGTECTGSCAKTNFKGDGNCDDNN